MHSRTSSLQLVRIWTLAVDFVLRNAARQAGGCHFRSVTFDRKSLESPLIQMPGAFRVIVGVPTHGMRVCQPPKEFRQLLVRLWSNHKVPVIGHQTIRKNRQRNSSDGFGKHSIECFVVLRLFKQCQSRHSSVEHMEAHSSRAFSRTSWHHRSVTKQTHRVKQNNELRPLFASFLPPLPPTPFCLH